MTLASAIVLVRPRAPISDVEDITILLEEASFSVVLLTLSGVLRCLH